MMSSIKTETLKLDSGISMEYTLAGSEHEETILFVHRLGCNLHQFDDQIQHFSGQYRVVAPSLRGHGGSSNPQLQAENGYTLTELAWDVDLLLTHLRIDSVHYVGNCVGGLAGYELYRLNPGKLVSLTTFGTAAELHSSHLNTRSMLATIGLLGSQKTGWLISRTAGTTAEVTAKIEEMFKSASKEALALIMTNMTDYSYLPVLRELHIPILLIKAGKDHVINARLASTLAVASERENCLVAEIPHLGHFCNMENPQEFNRVLGDFLGSNETDKAS